MGNNIEKLPLKTRIKTGVLSGLFFALLMAGFDYFNRSPFALLQFIFYSISFGFFMSLAFRNKVTKEKD